MKNKRLKCLLSSIKENNPGIDKDLLKAFRVVDRKFFVPDKMVTGIFPVDGKEHAYDDSAFMIAHGQTISQPSTVAKMLMLLNLKQGMKVLEVGTNTGYHAALTAFLVWPGEVFTIEIFSDLAKQARKNIKLLKNKKKIKFKIRIFEGDALDKKTSIWNSTYHRIYFTAQVKKGNIDYEEEVKEMGFHLLKNGGLLLYPTCEGLELWQKEKAKIIFLKRENGYTFVPLLRKVNLKN